MSCRDCARQLACAIGVDFLWDLSLSGRFTFGWVSFRQGLGEGMYGVRLKEFPRGPLSNDCGPRGDGQGETEAM